jgi:MFS family permease
MSGIITGPHFIKFFNTPGPIKIGTMVAVLEIGAFSEFAVRICSEVGYYMFIVTSIAAGRVGDIIGRRGTLFIGGVVFTLGGAVQTFTTGYWVMVIGRIVSGFGVGLLS